MVFRINLNYTLLWFMKTQLYFHFFNYLKEYMLSTNIMKKEENKEN